MASLRLVALLVVALPLHLRAQRLPGPIPNLVSHVTQLTITLSWMEAFSNGTMIENYTIIIQRGTTTVFTAFTDGFSTSISRFNLNQTVDDNYVYIKYTAIIYARNIYGNGPNVSVIFTVFPLSSVDPIIVSPLSDIVISKSSKDIVTFNCTYVKTSDPDSGGILWRIGNATLLNRDQYAGFGVNALDSTNRAFSQLIISAAGMVWLFNEIEEMNISVQCLGTESTFIVTEQGPIFSLVFCGTIPKVRDLRIDLLNGMSVVSWNRPSIYQPLDLSYSVVIRNEIGIKYERNTTDKEVTLPKDFNCAKCRVLVKSQNDSCTGSNTTVWDLGPIPICVTIKPLMRKMIGYICDDDDSNQIINVTIPAATTNDDDIVNRTVTASTRGVLQSTVTVFSNERSVKITGLVKQAQYDVTVTVCTDTCCQETKPVTLSTSCITSCSIIYYKIFTGIRCEFSDAGDESNTGIGVLFIYKINGEIITFSVPRQNAIAGYSISQILIAGSDVIAYDWNPVNGTRGNLLAPISVVTVTSREEFEFDTFIDMEPPSVKINSPSNETKSPSNGTKSPSNGTKSPSNGTKSPSNETEPPIVNDAETCDALAVGLIVGCFAPILGVLLGVIVTLGLSSYAFKIQGISYVFKIKRKLVDIALKKMH